MSLPRTLELGRAVLASTNPDLELWLATFITVLIPQVHTDIHNSSTASLLHLVSSERVWVGHAHHLRLIIEPTLGSEPIVDHHLQRITQSLLQLPLWGQLMLEPHSSLDTPTNPGTIRLDLAKANSGGTETGQKRPRMPIHVPVADIKPPGRLPSVTLHTVRLCMDILEPRQAIRPTGKRSRALNYHDVVSHPSSSSHSETHRRPRNFETLGSTDSPLTSIIRNDVRKRSRPAKISHQGQTSTECHNAEEEFAIQPSAYSIKKEHGLQDSAVDFAAAKIGNLIEDAIRIAIAGSLGKSLAGSKVKMNTIQRCLSDIAPFVWRPGFAKALHQRAHLAPILIRSMARMISLETARTPSLLLPRIASLAPGIQSQSRRIENDVSVCSDTQINELSSTLSDQAWIHMQETLTSRPVIPLLSGTGSNSQEAEVKMDDILADSDSLKPLNAPSGRNEEDTTEEHALLLDEYVPLTSVTPSILPEMTRAYSAVAKGYIHMEDCAEDSVLLS